MRRRRLAARWMVVGAVVVGCSTGGGCTDYAELTREAQGPRREGSVAGWRGREVEGESALGYAWARTVVVLGGADEAGVRRTARGTVVLEPVTLRGREVRPSLGSGVAVAEDGYVLTCAHCVDDEAFVVMAPDGLGGVRVGRGRVVWNGEREGGSPAGRVDMAIVHVAGADGRGLPLTPMRWAGPEWRRGGTEVVSVGVGGWAAGTARSAGGRIVAGPSEDDEPAWGATHEYLTDAPNIPGDSGGPAMTPDGGLLGIVWTVEVGRDGGFRSGVGRPNPAWVEAVITRDRAERRAAPGEKPERNAEDGREEGEDAEGRTERGG